MTVTDRRGLKLSNATPACAEALDAALDDALAFRGDPIARIDAVLAGHPDFVMGHVFRAGLLTQAMETRIYRTMVDSLEKAEALWDRANDRERAHIRAVRAWIEGDFHGAVQRWEAGLVDHPHDLLAMALIHLTDVLLGDVAGQRDCVARAFPLWDESIPGYEFVLGFYSFGLEENNAYSRAEEAGPPGAGAAAGPSLRDPRRRPRHGDAGPPARRRAFHEPAPRRLGREPTSAITCGGICRCSTSTSAGPTRCCRSTTTTCAAAGSPARSTRNSTPPPCCGASTWSGSTSADAGPISPTSGSRAPPTRSTPSTTSTR